jgi:pimeloyl-ACP methyl ester carboxylesterase
MNTFESNKDIKINSLQTISLTINLMRRIILIINIFLSAHLSAQEYKIKLEPSNGKFQEVEYAMWIPENLETVKGIIFHQHGCGESAFKSGRNSYHDAQWRALAKKWDFAFMSSSYVSKNDCHDWIEPEEGSYATFTKGISEIARQSKHKELEFAPWIIWGHSGGGHWAYKMVLQHPEKILCAVLKSPAWTDTSSLGLKVPILCLLGIQESYDVFSNFVWATAIEAMKYRIRKDAPVCIAPDQTSGHESARSRLLAISFIDAILKIRLTDSTNLISRDNQCFIDLDNFKLTNELKETNYKSRGNWFPDRLFAEKWSEFVRTGSVTDKTPPTEAPYNVRVQSAGKDNVIRWNANADVDSGIKGFKIYRNDQLINADSIQLKWNLKIDYHDNPIEITDKFEYADRNPKTKKSYKYQVSLINHYGLESPKSEAVLIRKD